PSEKPRRRRTISVTWFVSQRLLTFSSVSVTFCRESIRIIDEFKSHYRTSSDLILAININRDVKIKLSEVDATGLNIEQLWLIGDRTDGALMLHGGNIADWQCGKVFEGVMQNGLPSCMIRVFKSKVGENKGSIRHGGTTD
ncbi:MAG: hypothetical protein ACO1QB_19210, partial [Verrucomicrobiales bacterium]